MSFVGEQGSADGRQDPLLLLGRAPAHDALPADEQAVVHEQVDAVLLGHQLGPEALAGPAAAHQSEHLDPAKKPDYVVEETADCRHTIALTLRVWLAGGPLSTEQHLQDGGRIGGGQQLLHQRAAAEQQRQLGDDLQVHHHVAGADQE